MALSNNSAQEYSAPSNYTQGFLQYSERLQETLRLADFHSIARLSQALRECWASNNRIFLCGNGGSAANALHIANDLVFGANAKNGIGMRAEALSANTAIVSCLANDLGYEQVFSHQLDIQASAHDVLVVLSGSGNSNNIVKAIVKAKQLGLETFAILGFDGGKSKGLVDTPIHFAVNDMQVSEDLQLIVGHMVMQDLRDNCPGKNAC